jgi:hypothetical protein
MTTIEQVNQALKNFGKPTPKPAQPKPTRPNTALLKQRIAEARKSIGVLFAQAQKLKAVKIAAQIHELSAKLAAMEAELNKISNHSSPLPVRASLVRR